jgi:urea transporter
MTKGSGRKTNAEVAHRGRRGTRPLPGSSREAIRANPYFVEQARWLRWVYIALFATAAYLIVLSFTSLAFRSSVIVVACTVGFIVTDFVLIAKWLPTWRRMWREQNRAEGRTESDRAVARLGELLGQRHLPAKVIGIGGGVAVVLVPIGWGISPTLAFVCAGIALAVSLLVAWSLKRYEPQ